MNNPIVPATTSPFDVIMRTDDYGNEYWSARDLMTVMGYPRWNEFTPAISRAILSAEAQGHDRHALFRVNPEKSGGRPREDFQLARFACYLVAMNGDPRKTEVADAQAYFAIQTRVAETQVRALPSGPELLALAVVEAQKVIAAKDTAIAELTPKADAWHDLVSSAGSLSFRDAAKVISEEGGVTIGGVRLIEKLMDWGWCFRPVATPEEKAKGKTRSVRAYQTQIDAKTLTEKAKTYTDQVTGEKKLSNNPQTRITGKGLDAIRTRLLKELPDAA
ncbi:hypothetical protein AOZ07_02820 [Glutamicibacter halophytocola]|uniref:phage antirepressor KilAC domain-containing protein n=1 Tax=Glutamicibacter halophytocola TaxID=1933880 RepID=UPI0006D4AADD|nr:phage antirepressor KilAC domain-containing protein [Glutamicibacter halophytocola]ALG28033.1 hypothetical protein AOZ07_02820 [Glutamicibacter halophytocola]